MDKLNILSWNVQGLGGQAFPRFKGLIRADLDTPNVGAIDILFLQEHHLSADRIRSYGSILLGRWLHFWVPAIGPNSRQAGLCMAIKEKWASIIVSVGTMSNKRAQFLILQLGSQNTSIINLYASNSASERDSFRI